MKKLFYILIITFSFFGCSENNSDEIADTFLCCGENPFANLNVDNLDQSNGEIKAVDVFTPNNDGINDTFKIHNIEFYQENKVSIYNLNNNLVFETEEYENNVFVGVNPTNGSELPFGTYKYKIVVQDENTFLKYGYFCLIRDSSESDGFSFGHCNTESPNDPHTL